MRFTLDNNLNQSNPKPKQQFNQQQFNQQSSQQTNQQAQVANYGAHEALEVHEILSDAINGINLFELYRPHVQDKQLAKILETQLNFMIQGYNDIVSFLHNTGKNQSQPYRVQNNFSPKFGLRNPSPENPNMTINQLNDRDIASGMLGQAKAAAVFSTLAALECTDPNLRNIMKNCIKNKVEMAYETFQYMNQKGYYQVPTMQSNTTQTLFNSYQPVNIM